MVGYHCTFLSQPQIVPDHLNSMVMLDPNILAAQ